MPDKKTPVSVTVIKNGQSPVPAVAILAHEIKNPLNAIVGFTQVMCDESRKNISIKQMRDWAQIVHNATISLTKTCERILDEESSSFSVIKKENIDFNKFGKSIVALFQEEAKSQGVTLSLKVNSNFPTLHTDPVLLMGMLNNLISNAIKFTPRGGKVDVKGEVDVNSNALILVVQDTGEGISTDILMAIQRGEQVTTSYDDSKYKGWGIGMQIISENAQKLDCVFELYCPKNSGTVAYLKFPLITD